MSEPLPFLQPDENGKFHVNPQAAKVLSAITTKVAVVCVAGPYRTGKSYLLNCLIRNENPASQPPAQAGFTVGNTINACTKGIWLWSDPYYNPDNDTTYLFLDSEGLNSTGEEITFDTQIFSLTVLLSSIFILNTQNKINESDLEQLELVAECSKKISFSQSANAAESDRPAAKAQDVDLGELLAAPVDVDHNLALHFPRLIWVLRDFSLQLTDKQGDKITPNQYLESTLRPLPTTNARNARLAEEKNNIRRCIKDCFLKRDCHPLPRPVADESLLQKLQQLPQQDLNPEFRKGIKSLKTRLLQLFSHYPNPAKEKAAAGQNATQIDVVKYINNTPVTGDVLLGLAYAYCDAINNGEVPTILSAWQSVLETKKATEINNLTGRVQKWLWNLVQPSQKHKSGSREQNTPLAEPELDVDVITAKYNEQLDVLLPRRLVSVFPGDDNSINQVIRAVQKNTEETLEQVISAAEQLAVNYNQELFKTILKSPLGTSGIIPRDFISEKASFAVDKAGSGEKSENDFNQLHALLVEIFDLYIKKARGNRVYETAFHELSAVNKDLITQLGLVVIKLDQVVKSRVEKLVNIENQLAQTQQQLKSREEHQKQVETRLEKLVQQKENLQNKLLEEGKALSEAKLQSVSISSTVTQLEREIQQLQNANSALEDKIAKSRQEKQQLKSAQELLQQKLSQAQENQRNAQTLSAANSTLESQLNTTQHEKQTLAKSIQSLEREKHALEKDNVLFNEKLAALNDKYRHKSEQLDAIKLQLEQKNEQVHSLQQKSHDALQTNDKLTHQNHTLRTQISDLTSQLQESLLQQQAAVSAAAQSALDSSTQAVKKQKTHQNGPTARVSLNPSQLHGFDDDDYGTYNDDDDENMVKQATPTKPTKASAQRPAFASPLTVPDQQRIIERRRREGSIVPDAFSLTDDNNNNSAASKTAMRRKAAAPALDDDDDNEPPVAKRKAATSASKKTAASNKTSKSSAPAGVDAKFIAAAKRSLDDDGEAEFQKLLARSKKYGKEAVLAELQSSDEESNGADDDDDDDSNDFQQKPPSRSSAPSKQVLAGETVSQLKQRAQDLGIAVTIGIRKAALIDLILNHFK